VLVVVLSAVVVLVVLLLALVVEVVVVGSSVVVVDGASVVDVVVVDGASVVDVVVVDGASVLDVVVVDGASVVDVVVVDVGGPGTADQTKPLGSPLLAAKVICTFQLSVSTPAPVTQATPASQTPPPPSRVGTRLWALKPGPHSRSLGKVGTRSLDATLKLSTRPSASMKPYPVEITSWATVREEIVVPWGTK
jgi:hypothetical protein